MDCSNMSQNCSEEFTKDQKITLLSVFAGISAVSLIACIFTLSLAIYLKLYKNFSHRLAMYLVCSSLPTNIVHILQLVSLEYPDACIVIGGLRLYFSLIELLFTVCFSFHIFSLAVLQRDYKRFELIYCLVSIILPLTVAWIPYINNHYGVTVAWCGIRSLNSTFGMTLQFALWYVPVLIFQNLNAIAIVSIFIALCCRSRNWHKNGKQNEKEPLIAQHNAIKYKKALQEVLPILAYLIIFYVLTAIPLIHRLYRAINNDSGYTLAMLHVISSNSLWGLNCSITQLIHIGCNKKLRKKQKQVIDRTLDTKQLPTGRSAVRSLPHILKYPRMQKLNSFLQEKVTLIIRRALINELLCC